MPHVHLLVGGGTAQRRLLDAALADLEKRGYRDVRRQEGGDWTSLLTENRSAGLFDDNSVVVVEEAEKMGTMPERLAHLLEPKDASVVILLVAKSEVPALVPKEFIKACSHTKTADPSPWSKERDEAIVAAAKRQGLAIRRDAVLLLKDLFEDMGELASETEKVALACKLDGKTEVAVADVEGFCLSDGSRSLLKLLDGVCGGHTQESLRSLETLEKNGELLPLLSALHNRIRLALYAAAFPREKDVFAKALGARDYAMRQAEGAARLYGKQKLLDFVTGLIRINVNEKSGMGASWRDLSILLIELMS